MIPNLQHRSLSRMNWTVKIFKRGAAMKLIDEKAFLRFYDLAMDIADECDSLIKSQNEVAEFADGLRTFISILRPVLSNALPAGDDYSVQMPETLYQRIMTGLISIERAIGSEPECEKVTRRSNGGHSLSM